MKKQGFALVAVISLISVITLLAVSMFYMTSFQTYLVRTSIDRTKALSYAEAGIDYAFSILIDDFTQRDNLSVFGLDGASMNEEGGLESPFAEGSFAISLNPSSDRYCVVTSVGKCGDQSVTAEICSEDFNAGLFSSTTNIVDYSNIAGFKYPILSGGSFTSNGDVTIEGSGGTADIHTNGDMDLTKKQADNAANNMSTSGNFTKKPAVNGVTGVPPVPLPSIDLTPWENEAMANGMVINVGDPIPNPVSGGILVVKGTGTFTISSDIAATIIVDEANISVNADVTPGAGYTLGLVTKEGGGDIILNGNGSITGLTYTQSGDFSTHGTPSIYGQLIINGTTTIGGTVDAFIFSESLLIPPGEDITTTPYGPDVRIGAWQQ